MRELLQLELTEQQIKLGLFQTINQKATSRKVILIEEQKKPLWLGGVRVERISRKGVLLENNKLYSFNSISKTNLLALYGYVLKHI